MHIDMDGRPLWWVCFCFYKNAGTASTQESSFNYSHSCLVTFHPSSDFFSVTFEYIIHILWSFNLHVHCTFFEEPCMQTWDANSPISCFADKPPVGPRTCFQLMVPRTWISNIDEGPRRISAASAAKIVAMKCQIGLISRSVIFRKRNKDTARACPEASAIF